MKKLLSILIPILLLAGCAAGLDPLDESFDKAQVEEGASAVVALAVAGDYEGVCALLREDLTETIGAEALEAGWSPMLTQAGEYIGIARIRCYGTTDEQSGDKYAVAIVTSRHAHGQLTYTLSFDHDMALVGLYLK